MDAKKMALAWFKTQEAWESTAPPITVNFDWTIIANMKEKEKEKARRLSSEEVRQARLEIEEKLNGGNLDHGRTRRGSPQADRRD